MLIEFLRLLDRMVEPEALLIVSVVASGAAMLMRRRRTALVLQAVAVSVVVLFGLLPGGVWLALPLERWFPVNPPLPSQVAGIIALGGTERPTQSAAWGQPILSDPTPIAALIALGRRYPDAKLVFTGGAPPRDDETATESRIVRDFLRELGSDAERIIYEDRSRNTLENAIYSRGLIKPSPGEHWILVTQAISMPRAIAVFRHAGWTVTPYPAGYLTGNDARISTTIDLSGGLRLASLALHEWGGLIAYRLMGYTDTMFPE